MPKKFFQNDWDDQLQHEFEQPYYAQLRSFLRTAYKEQIVYPPMDELWTAFRLTPFQDVKVVILGQVICT